MANREDCCSGRFWEGRFKSQALLDEKALLACMAYVDLNPIRAKMAQTPETSEHTSIHTRIHQPRQHDLVRFTKEQTNQPGRCIPFDLKEYIQLVDWAGRCICADKRGAINAAAPPILQRLAMNHSVLLDYLSKKPDLPQRALGPVHKLRSMAESLGLKCLHGMSLGRQLYAGNA